MSNKYITIDRSTTKYVGYYEILHKICELIDKTPHKERERLIDKYIKILELTKELERDDK